MGKRIIQVGADGTPVENELREKVAEFTSRVSGFIQQLIEAQLGAIQDVEGLTMEQLIERYEIQREKFTGVTRIIRRTELHGKPAGSLVGYAVAPTMTENGVVINLVLEGTVEGQPDTATKEQEAKA